MKQTTKNLFSQLRPIETELCDDLNLLPEPIVQIDLDPTDSERDSLESLNDDLVPGVDLQGDNAESTAINLSEGVGDLGTEWDLLIPETNVFPSNSTSDSEDLSSDKADFDNDNYSTEQLIETLLAANPPPTLTVSDFSETTAEPLSFNILSGLNNLTLRLTNIDGIEVLQLIDNEGAVQTEQTIADTSKVVITGLAGEDDTLTVDFSGGIIPVPITFHGGDGGFDSLVIGGGSFFGASYSAGGPDAGSIVLGETTITYTGLEPITDDNIVDDRVFTITTTGVDQQVRIGDDSDPNNGYSTIDSNGTGGFESITFLNPANSLTVYSGDGNDTIILDTPDNGFAAPIIIDGQAGDDTLIGPDGSSTWNITGENAGNIGGTWVVDFDGIENLIGCPNNEDTFVFHENGSISGVVEGGDGGFDSLVIESGSYTNVAYIVTGPDSGVIVHDGRVIVYSGLEPITDGSSPENLTFDASGSNDNILLSYNTTDGMVIDSGGTSETLVFTDPADIGSLTINALGGDDTITIESVAPGWTASITVNGGENDDMIVGPDLTNIWTMTDFGTGNVAGDVDFSFTDMENLFGGTGDDTLIGPDVDTMWSFEDTDAGSVADVNFVGFEKLTGGAGADTFVFVDDSNFTGVIDDVNGVIQDTSAWANGQLGDAILIDLKAKTGGNVFEWPYGSDEVDIQPWGKLVKTRYDFENTGIIYFLPNVELEIDPSKDLYAEIKPQVIIDGHLSTFNILLFSWLGSDFSYIGDGLFFDDNYVPSGPEEKVTGWDIDRTNIYKKTSYASYGEKRRKGGQEEHILEV